MSKIYVLNGREVRDFNGVPHDAKTGAPINAATGQTLSPAEFNTVLNQPPRRPASAPGGARYRDTPLNNGGRSGPLPEPAAPIEPAAPPSDQPTGRDTTPPDGTDAKGTNTGFKGFKLDLASQNAALASVGVRPMADVNSFFSEQLPISAAEKPVQPGESLPTPGNTGSAESAQLAGATYGKSDVVEGISTAGQKEKPFASPTETADNNRSISVPGEQSVKPLRGGVDERFAEGAEYGESYATNYSKLRTAQRNAFLDHEGDSLGASMAGNSAIGRATRGGKYYFNDGGELKEVTRDAYTALGNDKLTAEGLKNAYVSGISQTLVAADTPDVTEPSATATSTRKPGKGTTYDADGFSVGDATAMGYSQEDAEAIGSGGQVETVFTPSVGTESEFTSQNDPPTGDDTYFGGKAQGIRDMRDKYFNK